MNRAAPQPLFEVKLKGGKLWRGTEQELRSRHPNWLQYARPVSTQPPPSSPHHAGFYSGIHPEDAPYLSDQFSQEEEDDDPFSGADHGAEPPRMANSAVKLRSMPHKPAPQDTYIAHPDVVVSRIPARLSAQQAPTTNAPTCPKQTPESQSPAKRKTAQRHAHPLLYLGLGMLVMLGLWVAGSSVFTYVTKLHNDWTYTTPFRTFSVDYAVGHNHDSPGNPSHFIVQNDKGHVVIIELAADDMHHAFIYTGPTLSGTDGMTQPVTITFQRNPTTGRIDLMLHVGTMIYRYVNNGTKFTEPQQ